MASRPWFTTSRRIRFVAVSGALTYVTVVLVTWLLAYGSLTLLAGLFTVQVGPWLVYAFGGAGLVGAALAVSLDRYGLVGPTAVVAGLFAFALFRLWQARQNPAVLLVGDPFQLYLVAWPAVFAVAGVVGALERYVRNAVDERDTTESAG